MCIDCVSRGAKQRQKQQQQQRQTKIRIKSPTLCNMICRWYNSEQQTFRNLQMPKHDTRSRSLIRIHTVVYLLLRYSVSLQCVRVCIQKNETKTCRNMYTHTGRPNDSYFSHRSIEADRSSCINKHKLCINSANMYRHFAG